MLTERFDLYWTVSRLTGMGGTPMNDCRKIYHAGALTDVLEILCREFRRFRIGGDHSGNPTDYERSVVQRSRSEEATNSVSVLL